MWQGYIKHVLQPLLIQLTLAMAAIPCTRGWGTFLNSCFFGSILSHTSHCQIPTIKFLLFCPNLQPHFTLRPHKRWHYQRRPWNVGWMEDWPNKGKYISSDSWVIRQQVLEWRGKIRLGSPVGERPLWPRYRCVRYISQCNGIGRYRSFWAIS